MSYLDNSEEIRSKDNVYINKVKVSMTIDNDLWEWFKEYCNNNGMKMSTKINNMISIIKKDEKLKNR